VAQAATFRAQFKQRKILLQQRPDRFPETRIPIPDVDRFRTGSVDFYDFKI
jgi:hypothetical protein